MLDSSKIDLHVIKKHEIRLQFYYFSCIFAKSYYIRFPTFLKINKNGYSFDSFYSKKPSRQTSIHDVNTMSGT